MKGFAQAALGFIVGVLLTGCWWAAYVVSPMNPGSTEAIWALPGIATEV